MELLDSRCPGCSSKLHQCSACQKVDSQKRAKKRKEAADAKALSALQLPIVDAPGPVSHKKRKEAAAAKSLSASPSPIVAAPEPSPARAAKPRLKNFRKQLSADGWTLLRTPRNGHCLFEAIAKGIQLYRPESAMTMKKLRSECSAKMMELNGEVPNWPTNLFHENVHGLRLTPLQIHRGEETTPVTLDEYCQLLGSNLYGGQEEIALMANMYKLQVNVFHSEFIEPQRYLQNPNLDPNHPDNAGNIIGCRI